MIDEHEATGQLSQRSWAVLRRLGYSMEEGPWKAGLIVFWPEPDFFDPELIADRLDSARAEALLEGLVSPTEEERKIWFRTYVEHAWANCDPMYGLQVWRVRDDRERERILVTIHGDRAAFEQVAGLYETLEAAEADLLGYGQIEWNW